MVDPFQYTLQGGLELPISSSSTTQVEAGWVFGHLGEMGEDELFSQTGLKLRLSWREYFDRRTPSKRPSYVMEGAYFAIMGGYQRYNQTIRVDTSGGWGGYQDYERVVQAFELTFLLGYQTQIGRRLVLDVWGGLGLRHSRHSWAPMRPPLSYWSFLPVGDIIMRPGGRPVPRIGIAMGWILK
jgi:hypothetical protein